MWQNNGEDIEVAIKMLKEGAKSEDKVKFLQEAAIMGQFKHPNVVNMHGIISDGEPVSAQFNFIVCCSISLAIDLCPSSMGL